MKKVLFSIAFAAPAFLGACATGPKAAVPNVIGADIDAARTTLEHAGFGTLEEPAATCADNEKPTGKVIRQRPAPGTQQNTQSVVVLLVDCGAK